MKDKKDRVHPLIRAWFFFTGEERWLIGGVLAIALVGLTARYLHLRGEKPEPYEPAGIQTTDKGERP